MPIYQGETKKALFKGDYHPAEMYKGEKKLTGYEIQAVSGEEISVENTYNDNLSPTILGNGIQSGTPTPDAPVYPAFSEGALRCEGRNLFCNHFDAYTRPKDYRILPINLPQGTYCLSAEKTGHIVTGVTIAVARFGESYSDFKNDIRIVVDNTGAIVPQMIKIDSTWTSPKLAVYCKTEDLWNEFFTNYHVQLEKGRTATQYQPYRPPISIDLPLLRAIPDGNGGFSAKDSLTPVEGMPGWYDLCREVGEEQIIRLARNDRQVGSYTYYTHVPAEGPGVKMCSHYRYNPEFNKDEGFFSDANMNYGKVLYFNMKGLVSQDNSEIPDDAEAMAWLASQAEAGTPLTVWYPLESPTTERIELGELNTYPYYTHIYSDCAVKPLIEGKVKTIGGQT